MAITPGFGAGEMELGMELVMELVTGFVESSRFGSVAGVGLR